MTDRHRSFGSVEPVPTEPVTFTLVDEEFECVPAIAGARLLAFVAEADSKDGGRAANALLNFLRQVIVPEDIERFEKVIDERYVSIETIGEICGWLVEVYTERPTARPSRSRRGSGASGPTSTDDASSTDAT